MVKGRILTAVELTPLVPEGRDAVRKALRELISAGYVIEDRYRTSTGHFAVDYTFNQAWVTRDGFSGGLYRGTANSTSTNNFIIVEELTNVSSPTTSCEHEMSDSSEEYVEMTWPMFDGEEPAPKKTRAWVDDSDAGAVGKIEEPMDKKEMRKLKYKKTKFEAVPARMLRHERDEALWTTDDLVGEFYDLTRDAAPGVPSQVNGANLAKWINQKVGEGIPRAGLLRALRAFFNDPRLVRDPGVGQPLWRRFIAWYPTVHGIYSKETELEYSDDDFLAHQAKMLSLLED